MKILHIQTFMILHYTILWISEIRSFCKLKLEARHNYCHYNNCTYFLPTVIELLPKTIISIIMYVTARLCISVKRVARYSLMELRWHSFNKYLWSIQEFLPFNEIGKFTAMFQYNKASHLVMIHHICILVIHRRQRSRGLYSGDNN